MTSWPSRPLILAVTWGGASPAGRPLEQHLAGGALAQGRHRTGVGAGQVVDDDQAVRGGLAGIEGPPPEAEHGGGRGGTTALAAA
jgi:hypothetical protein